MERSCIITAALLCSLRLCNYNLDGDVLPPGCHLDLGVPLSPLIHQLGLLLILCCRDKLQSPPSLHFHQHSDRCCHKHDCCYDKAEREGCSPKMLRYEWTCERNAVVCDTLTDRCQKMVCQCDQEAAKCWGTASYNPHYVLWPDFLCGQSTPTCHVS
ncbi:phospholipase A2-like isoform X1 [Trachemys scripta elegans]|uniref:phospholipase A2-like isoform X1 n=1 Tax=Trachemys scripta elegans TaxID=31138 RepID=UPI0015561C61|nr:phospholipase A2-like isoform X1 [Trachemys scripta elegans]